MPVFPSYRNQFPSYRNISNKLTGFYMSATLALNRLKEFIIFEGKNIHIYEGQLFFHRIFFSNILKFLVEKKDFKTFRQFFWICYFAFQNFSFVKEIKKNNLSYSLANSNIFKMAYLRKTTMHSTWKYRACYKHSRQLI